MLYKCDHFDEKVCKDYKGCMCKYTFDPRHIWDGTASIIRLVATKASIECDARECPGPANVVFMKPYIKEDK
jgi:hypothetical protein